MYICASNRMSLKSYQQHMISYLCGLGIDGQKFCEKIKNLGCLMYGPHLSTVLSKDYNLTGHNYAPEMHVLVYTDKKKSPQKTIYQSNLTIQYTEDSDDDDDKRHEFEKWLCPIYDEKNNDVTSIFMMWNINVEHPNYNYSHQYKLNNVKIIVTATTMKDIELFLSQFVRSSSDLISFDGFTLKYSNDALSKTLRNINYCDSHKKQLNANNIYDPLYESLSKLHSTLQNINNAYPKKAQHIELSHK